MVSVARTLLGSVGSLLLFGCAAASPPSNPRSAASVVAEFDESRAQTTSGSPSAPTLDGQALERAAYVRAVLAKNPSLDAARHGMRAALGRVHQAGSFEDPMLDVGVAPLSIGSREAR